MLKIFIDRKWDDYSFYSDESLQELNYSYSKKDKLIGFSGALINKDKQTVFELTSKKGISKLFDDSVELHYNNNVLVVDVVDVLKHHCSIELGDTKYDAYRTTGARYSIFKNDLQIGGIIEFKTRENKNVYVFKTDESETFLIQLAMFLIIDKSYDDAFNSFSSLYVEGPYVKKSDMNWFSKRFMKIP